MYETFLFMRVPDDDGESWDAFQAIYPILSEGLLVEKTTRDDWGKDKHSIDEFVFDGSGDNCNVWIHGSVYRVRARLNSDKARSEIGRSLARFPTWCVFQPGEGAFESVDNGPLSRSLLQGTTRGYAHVFIRDSRGESCVRSLAEAIVAAAGKGAACPMTFLDGSVVVVPSDAPAKILASRLAIPLRGIENWAIYDFSGAFAASSAISPSWQPSAFKPWEADAVAAASDISD